jgi:hypothetical protein
VKTATDHQGTTTVTETVEAEATVTESIEVTETATAATDMETEEAAEGAAMTDVSAIDIVAAQGTIITIRDIPPTMKMTGVVTITTEVHAKTKDTAASERVVAVEEDEEGVTIWDPLVVSAVDEGAAEAVVVVGDRIKKEWALPKDGHRHPKVLYPCPSEGERPLAGMFTPQDTSSIRPYRPNRQVTYFVVNFASRCLTLPFHRIVQPPGC